MKKGIKLKYSYNKCKCYQQVVKMSCNLSYELKEYLDIFETKPNYLEDCKQSGKKQK